MNAVILCLTYGALVAYDDYTRERRGKPSRAITALLVWAAVVISWRLIAGDLP